MNFSEIFMKILPAVVLSRPNDNEDAIVESASIIAVFARKELRRIRVSECSHAATSRPSSESMHGVVYAEKPYQPGDWCQQCGGNFDGEEFT